MLEHNEFVLCRIASLHSLKKSCTSFRFFSFISLAMTARFENGRHIGALNKRELKQMKNALQGMKVLHIDEESSTLFADLMLNYSISHRLKIPDAMIAAIAITNQVLFYTENVKDFDFIPEMQLYKPK